MEDLNKGREGGLHFYPTRSLSCGFSETLGL